MAKKIILLSFVLCIIPKTYAQLRDTVIYYYASGEKMTEGITVNGLKEGAWISYYKPGQKSSVQYFQKGKIGGAGYTYSGKEYAWYPNGNLKEEFSWLDGKIHGIQKTYYENGRIKKEWIWEKGLYYKEERDYYDNAANTLKTVIQYEWYNIGKDLLTNRIPRDLVDIFPQAHYYYPDLKKSSWKCYYPSGALMIEGAYEKGDFKAEKKEYCRQYHYEENTKRVLHQFNQEKISCYNISVKEYACYIDSIQKKELEGQRNKFKPRE